MVRLSSETVLNAAREIDCRACKEEAHMPCRSLRNGKTMITLHSSRTRDARVKLWNAAKGKKPRISVDKGNVVRRTKSRLSSVPAGSAVAEQPTNTEPLVPIATGPVQNLLDPLPTGIEARARKSNLLKSHILNGMNIRNLIGCVTCEVSVGHRCVNQQGNVLIGVHAARHDTVQRARISLPDSEDLAVEEVDMRDHVRRIKFVRGGLNIAIRAIGYEATMQRLAELLVEYDIDEQLMANPEKLIS